MTDFPAEAAARGFCTIRSPFPTADIERMRQLVDDYLQRCGVSSLSGRGRGIHPLIERIPAFRTYLTHAPLMNHLSAILGATARLMRSGARVSDESSQPELAHWHNHYHWKPDRLAARPHIERVLAVIYLDGSGPDRASCLVVRPRCLNDALGAPPEPEGPRADVLLDPGDVVVFDSALWHSAYRGTGSGRRRIVGGHYQASDVKTPHPDDDVALVGVA